MYPREGGREERNEGNRERKGKGRREQKEAEEGRRRGGGPLKCWSVMEGETKGGVS